MLNNQTNKAGEKLENAFQLFNQLSEKLAGSYEGLESQVAQLSKELCKEREEKLKQLAEKELLAKRLESLLDALPAGIIVLDSEGLIIQTNPVSREMLNLDIKVEGNIKQNWKVIANNNIISNNNELRLKDGRRVALSACSLGEYPGKILLISDVTETHTLQSMLNRQDRLSSLGEMIAGLAHQIRTPLSSALLYISGINHPENNDTEKVYFADKAKDRLCHLERMVNDMLMFAKGEASNDENVYIEKLLMSLKELSATENESHNVIFNINENLSKVTVKANDDALISAIQNIIENSFDACAIAVAADNSVTPNTEVSAFLNSNNDVQINIKDNGCGMSIETQERVLEPFFTNKNDGTGLGLAVVNSTITRCGGEMTIDTQVNEGATFMITLPRSIVDGMLPSNLTSRNDNAQLKKQDCELVEVEEV